MDYFGYKLAPSYNDLTVEQALFIDLGRCELEKEMNGNDETKRSIGKSNLRHR